MQALKSNIPGSCLEPIDKYAYQKAQQNKGACQDGDITAKKHHRLSSGDPLENLIISNTSGLI